jgi:hypothetical protein
MLLHDERPRHARRPSAGASHTESCFEFIAAALAIMCGYYWTKTSKPNFCGAAKDLGHATDDAKHVRNWMAKLVALEKRITQAALTALASWRQAAAMRWRMWEEPEAVKRERAARSVRTDRRRCRSAGALMPS